MVILETGRLILREMADSDLPALKRFLQDPEVMAAYEHAFSDEEVSDWLDRQKKRYREDGFGLWAVVLKETGKMIGDCGLTWQETEEKKVLEIGYHLEKAYWHQGYAIEAATACRDYAFHTLNQDEVYSIIRDSNRASQKVAKRNGMTVRGMFQKHYRGIDMPHLIYSVRKNEISTNGIKRYFNY